MLLLVLVRIQQFALVQRPQRVTLSLVYRLFFFFFFFFPIHFGIFVTSSIRPLNLISPTHVLTHKLSLHQPADFLITCNQHNWTDLNWHANHSYRGLKNTQLLMRCSYLKLVSKTHKWNTKYVRCSKPAGRGLCSTSPDLTHTVNDGHLSSVIVHFQLVIRTSWAGGENYLAKKMKCEQIRKSK